MVLSRTSTSPKEEATVHRKSIVSWGDVKGLFGEDRDSLKDLLHEVIQEVLEAERNDALGAQKGERTGDHWGIAAGITRGR